MEDSIASRDENQAIVTNSLDDSKTDNNPDTMVDLKGLSTAFKTIHERSASKSIKSLKNRKKSQKPKVVVDVEAKRQSKLLRKCRESIRRKPSEYDVKGENTLKNIAKKGVINALKTIYETQSF